MTVNVLFGKAWYVSPMENELKADDLLPLISKLSIHERQRLFEIAMRRESTDDKAYAAVPPTEAEFSSDEDSLSWDADGWEGFE